MKVKLDIGMNGSASSLAGSTAGSENTSLSNTPTHSRNPSDVGMMGNLGTPQHMSTPKSTGDLFEGFVISVHRKMVGILQ